MNSWRVLAAVVSAVLVVETGSSQPGDGPKPDQSFFPVAVWYGGGKARAPMMERIDAASAHGWHPGCNSAGRPDP